MTAQLPNCVYIGPGKTGSTWLFEFFKFHPDVFVTPAKDLYFFDRFYDRGLDWYSKQFSGAASESVVAEICHDYIVCPEAPQRIAASLPGVKLMMFLREPVERTFSAYLYRVKHGIYKGSFEDAIQDRPEVFKSSLYSQYLREYVQHFSVNDILVFAFDDLKKDPQGFADQICDRLEIQHVELPELLLGPTLKAAKARWLPAAKLVKFAAHQARYVGLADLVGKLKTNRLIQRFLYSEFEAGSMPKPTPETIALLRDRARASVQELDEMMGTDFCGRWGY